MSAHSSSDSTVFDRHTILLVEDNEDDAFMMQRAFQKAGVPNPLQCVSDAHKAMAYLERQGRESDRRQFLLPVVILLDLNMPKMNGLELLRWIRQQPALKRTTVHVLTASNRGADVEQAFDSGANAYLVKPGKFEELVEMVKAWHIWSQFAAFPAIGGGKSFSSPDSSGIMPPP